MGFFKNLELEVVELYYDEGADEYEISQILAIPEQEVNRVLTNYEERHWRDGHVDIAGVG